MLHLGPSQEEEEKEEEEDEGLVEQEVEEEVEEDEEVVEVPVLSSAKVGQTAMIARAGKNHSYSAALPMMTTTR
jgi:hypothetical protein